MLDLEADEEPGRVLQEQERQVERVPEADQARGLLDRVGRLRADEEQRLEAMTATGRPSSRPSAVMTLGPKRSPRTSSSPWSRTRRSTLRMS